jgi:serine protease Do
MQNLPEDICVMFPKKMLLFSASLLLVACVSANGQQASSATPASRAAQAAQADGSSAVTLGFSGGNYIGITTAEVTRENMGRYNMREPRGVVVTRVAEDSPASRAGLKAGDVILSFDNEPVTSHRKLQRLISEAAPEQNVRLRISRGGAEQELSVTIGERRNGFQNLFNYPADRQGVQQAQRALEQFGMDRGNWGFQTGRRIGINTTQLTKQLADYFGVPGGRGVLVTSVAENSPAARAGLKAGDVITETDGEKIESSGDLSRAINRKTDGSVTLKVVRDRNPMTITVTPEKSETGAILISPGLPEIDTTDMEIVLPTIDIKMPQMKPITLPRIKVPAIRIKPQQLEQLRKLEKLNQQLENLKLESVELESLMVL